MNYISLGYFCSVAMELERFGLRNQSSPFDWVIADFKGVISAIENHFEDFLEYRYLEQSSENRRWYKNIKYQIEFHHDFNEYQSLESQLAAVQEKYNRRIKRFYETIQQPTIFVRYISDEQKYDGISEELIWIENNWDKIQMLLKSFHPQNELLLIANVGVTSEKSHIYSVEPDCGDVVARIPAEKNTELRNYFENAMSEGKQKNLQRYKENQKQKSRVDVIFKRKAKTLLKRIFLKPYIHEKEY